MKAKLDAFNQIAARLIVVFIYVTAMTDMAIKSPTVLWIPLPLAVRLLLVTAFSCVVLDQAFKSSHTSEIDRIMLQVLNWLLRPLFRLLEPVFVLLMRVRPGWFVVKCASCGQLMDPRAVEEHVKHRHPEK